MLNENDYNVWMNESTFVKLLTLMLMGSLCLGQSNWCNISSSSPYTGSSTAHSLECTFTNYNISTPSTYLFLNYSSAWNLASLSHADPSDFCDTGCTLASVTVTTPSPNNVKVTGLIPNTLTNAFVSFRFTLKNIISPSFNTVQTISVSFFTNLGSLISSMTIKLNIYPAPMGCSIASISNLALQATATYTFTVTPSVALPNDGYMNIKFPTVWTNSLVGPTLASLSCSGANCTLSNNTLVARGLVASASSTASFTFSISSVTNPGTEQPNTDLSFAYYYSNNSQISYCQVNISGLVSPTLIGATFNITDSVGIITFTNVLLPLKTDELLIPLPPEISINNFLKANILIGTSGSLTPRDPRIITNTNHISLTPYASSSITLVQIFLSNITMLYPATTSNIIISLRRANYQYSYADCGPVTLSTNQTLAISVTLTNYFLQATSHYVITFTPVYYGIYYILVNLGSAVSLTPATTYSCYLSTITNSVQMVCTAISTYQIKATLTNTSASFASLLGYASNYSLVIIGLTNPSQVQNTLQLSTYYLPSNQLEYSNIYTITYLSALVVNAAITCSSYVVGAASDYTFSINNTNALLPSSTLHIYFPASFTISNTSNSCTVNNTVTPCIAFNSTYLQFTLPGSLIPSFALPYSTLTVLNITNPNSIEPTPSFGLSLESGGAVVQVLNDGLTVSMTTLTNFTSLTVTPNNLRVGNLASYTITFTHPLTVSSSSTVALKFQLPSSFTLANCTACTSHQTFTVAPPSTNSGSFVISSVYNPQKVAQTSTFFISLYVDGYLSIQDAVSPPNYTALNTTWNVSSNSSYLGQSIAVNITISNVPLTTKFLIITIPPEYTIGTLSAFSEGSFNFTYALTNYTINFTVTLLSAENATLMLEGLSNPTSANSSAWQITIYSSSSVLISLEGTSFKFNATCGASCRSCNSTHCLSCYSNLTGNTLIYLNSNTSLCVNACLAQGEYLQGSTCYTCSASCLSCSLFANNCTSCSGNAFLYASQCISPCPDSYYGQNNTCVGCSNNCRTCTSSSVCLTCASNYVLQTNATCLPTCASGYYNYSNVCNPCPTNCLTCTPNGCATCNGSNYLTSSPYPSCVSACPTGTYISANNLTCEACQSPCLTCSLSSHNCTSCSSSSTDKYLSGFSCLGACPNQTYADEFNQCQACMSPCLNCNNLNNCTSCSASFLYYPPSNECVPSCFSNTVNVSNVCTQCSPPCLTCASTTSNCTACVENYFLLNHTCSPNCSSPYVVSNNTCALCYSPCLTCTAGNITNCLSCMGGYFLFSNMCYQTCPSRTYQNSGSTCAVCSAPCFECSSSPSNCTSCFNGSFIVSNSCYFPCPPGLYQNGISCEGCQPQCASCNHSTSEQCSSCSSPAYYFNPITYHCTPNCTPPYYARNGSMECEPCQLPCKSCAALSSACSSCYGGYFLLSQLCLSACGAGYYGDSIANTCVQCVSPCATCDNQKCFTCQTGAYFYQGMCYGSCPLPAPYVLGLYCRNCLLDNCINCNSEGLCTMCLPSYYSYNGACLGSCPADYEPDYSTNSQCVLSSQIAYYRFIKRLQSQKMWLVPASAALLLSLPFLYFAEVRLFYLAFALGIPQTLSLVEMAANYAYNWAHFIKALLPQWLMLAVLGAQLLLSALHTLLVRREIEKEESFKRWVEYGSNRCRYNVIVTCSLVNKQFLYLIFSGLFGLPFTSCKFVFTPLLYACHTLFMLLQAVIFAVGILIVSYEDTLQYNLKLFYSSVDLLLVYGATLLFQLVFLALIRGQPSASDYEKYILPNVSNKTLPAFSEPNEEEVESPPNNLHRSNSDEDIFESKEMKDVEFMSAFDPDQYLEETPNLDLDKVEEGIDRGAFRKKTKKKRGHRKEGRLDLDVIEEEEEEQRQQKDGRGKGKKRKGRKEDDGGLKNYIYFKKPKEKKANPTLLLKQNESLIMSRIREKESEFDSITQNDIIFQEYNEDSSSGDDYNIQEESRRVLHKPSYDNYFNLNYASKKHLHQVEED